MDFFLGHYARIVMLPGFVILRLFATCAFDWKMWAFGWRILNFDWLWTHFRKCIRARIIFVLKASSVFSSLLALFPSNIHPTWRLDRLLLDRGSYILVALRNKTSLLQAVISTKLWTLFSPPSLRSSQNIRAHRPINKTANSVINTEL